MELRFPHSLAVCAIVRNEGKFIREWLEWHIMMGVSKFYLYDNDSNDNTAAVLRPFVKKGIVEYIFYPGKYRQIAAYNDCIFRHKYDCEWMAFIDADEFLHPLGQESVLEILRTMGKSYPQMGALAVNWRVYGSGGHISSVSGVISSYTRRAKDGYKDNSHIKSIVNPRRVRRFVSAHYPAYYRGYFALDEEGLPVNGHFSKTGGQPLRRICLAHYLMKSWEDWQNRRKLGKADAPGEHDVSRAAFEKLDAPLNEVVDESLLRLREKFLAEQGGVLKLVQEKVNDSREMEMGLNELLMGYPSLDVEQLMTLYHNWNSNEEGLSREQAGSLIISLLHMYLACNTGISIRHYDMLKDEIKAWSPGDRGREVLSRDLARLKSALRDYKLHKPDGIFDLYLDRLAESWEPDYLPRVALAAPDLEESPENRGLLLLAKIFLQANMEVVLYAATDGSMRQEFLQAGLGTILLDKELLHKSLNDTGWYGGYDLVCLNTCRCIGLLESHTAPAPRPVFWWLHEGDGAWLEQAEAKESLRRISSYMLTTVAAEARTVEALRQIDGEWPISGIMRLPAPGQEEAFRREALSLLEQLVHVGVSYRIPFEEGIH